MTYPQWREAFASALDDRYYPIDWLDREVSSGRALFKETENAAIVAKIEDYPSGARAIVGICAAGDATEIIGALIPQAEALGKKLGCSSAFIDSREAWGRLLDGKGYVAYKSCIRKEL